MKLKQFALGLLAATAMGSAMAQGISTTPASSTMIVMIGDQNHSYLYDTGVSMSALMSSGVNYSVTLPNWSQFNFASTTPFDNLPGGDGVRWGLISGTFATNVTGNSLMVTGSLDALNDGSLNTGYSNSGIKTSVASLNQYYHIGVQPFLATGANVVTTTSDSAYVGDPQFNYGYGGNLNAQGLVAGTNTIGIYYETAVAGSLTKPVSFTQMAEVATLDTASGTLTIAVSAVPEPSTYAMLAAGLACGMFIVRRRNNNA